MHEPRPSTNTNTTSSVFAMTSEPSSERVGGHKEQLELKTAVELDAWEKAIASSGCADYHETLQDCYYEHNDWRKCTKEMLLFRECMSRQKRKETSHSN